MIKTIFRALGVSVVTVTLSPVVLFAAFVWFIVGLYAMLNGATMTEWCDATSGLIIPLVTMIIVSISYIKTGEFTAPEEA